MVTKKTKTEEDWKDVAIHFAVGAMRELGNTILRSFHEKVDSAVGFIIRKLFSTVLLCVGLVFLLVGLAQLLNDLVKGSSSVGYVLVGAVAIFVSMMISIVKGEKV